MAVGRGGTVVGAGLAEWGLVYPLRYANGPLLLLLLLLALLSGC